MLRSLWLRLSRRARLEQDLRDEVEFHLALKTEKLGDAHGAQRSFGNDTLIREDLRDAWSFRLAESVWQDIRHAVRAILRTPGFAIIAVLSLAIGVGANTAIFTVLHGLFLKSLPVKEPGRLRIINWTGEMTPATNVSGYGLQHQGLRTSSSFSWDALNTFASKDSAFESVGGFSDLRPNVVAGGRAQVVNTYIVS
ncbi:MAG: hypothetical protein H7Y20_06710, partial [Bryobacteraceae bacterium]|nr:hypothetical protein [Bryobacteraceae bacterium]